MSVFDVYTVTVVTSPFGPLTEMSAHPSHPRGARPKTTIATPKVRYACVACEFQDFKTTHSLRRHLIQIHNISCNTLVQGRPFPHLGYMMRKPNERERHQFPRSVFPDEWAVSQRPDIDPADVSDRPPPHHRFVGRWPNVCCVPICNADGTDNLFGLSREHDITKNPLRFTNQPMTDDWQLTNQPMTDDWQLSQVQGRGDARTLGGHMMIVGAEANRSR